MSLKKKQDYELITGNDDNSMTVSEVIEYLGFGKYQILYSIVIGLTWLAESVENGFAPILSTVLYCVWGLSSSKEALLTASSAFGISFSYFILGILSDRFGRKTTQLCALFIAFCFGFGSAFAPNYLGLLVLRLFYSLMLAMTTLVYPYTHEICPKNSRSTVIIISGVFWCVGTLVPTGLGAVLLTGEENLNQRWRVFTALSAVPLFIGFLALFLIDESPQFLMNYGREKEALATLANISARNGVPLPPNLKLIPDRISPENKSFKEEFLLLWKDKRHFQNIIGFTIATIVLRLIYLGLTSFVTELVQLSEGQSLCSARTEGCYVYVFADYVKLSFIYSSEYAGMLFGMCCLKNVHPRYYCFGTSFGILIVGGGLYFCPNTIMLAIILMLMKFISSSAIYIILLHECELFPTSIRNRAMGFINFVSFVLLPGSPFLNQVLSKVDVRISVTIYEALAVVSMSSLFIFNSDPTAKY